MPISEHLINDLKKTFRGEITSQPAALSLYSRDASLFEVRPELIVFPQDADDIQNLVRFIRLHKKDNPDLSLTVRAAGTCMSGGPLGESIILDITRHLHGVLELKTGEATVLPGTFYRDLEKATLASGQILPSYTASKDLNAIGGMIGNNSGGEKNLHYGKTERYVKSLDVVLADGKEYKLKALNTRELELAKKEQNFLGHIYRELAALLDNNRVRIEKSQPTVSKNSAGYALWDIWDGEIFDLTKLITGSQGTLGIVTKATLGLVPVKPQTKLVTIFLTSLAPLAEVVNVARRFSPDSIESYDDHTLRLALRFLPALARKLKAGGLFRLIYSFLPEFLIFIRGGWPKLVLLVEFSGSSIEEIERKAEDLVKALLPLPVQIRQTRNAAEAEKYWTIRRESFNLLRQHLKGKRTAPFIDDIIVHPADLPEFLPELRALIDRYHLTYTIAGHAGDGNFHIIPLLDMSDRKNKEMILELSDQVYDLVIAYGGSITAEHNDGIIRTPYLEKMYGPEMVALFRSVKQIFDPDNIFNPGKKVGGDFDYIRAHLVKN